MSRLKLLLVITFVLVFIAGAVVGTTRRPAAPAPLATEGPERQMAIDLGLTPQQQEQMKNVWSGIRDLHRQADARRDQFEQERERSVRALLTPDQAARYDEIQNQYRTEMQGLEKDREKIFAQADEKTKQILTPEQWAKFEKVRKERMAHMHHPGFHHPTSGPTSAPSPGG